MKRLHWILACLFILLVHLIAIIAGSEWLVYITKPMIVATLIAYFTSVTSLSLNRLRIPVVIALAFCLAGDILLLLQPNDEIFFLLGLASFLLGHVFYILFLLRLKKSEAIRFNFLLLIPVLAYYVVLILFLYPYLGEMRIPVIVYGAVISTMLLLALHMNAISKRIAGQWMMAGAILFVISDSLLALNKFYQPFPGAAILIMLTYGLAQFFIGEGAGRYLAVNRSE